MQSKCKVIAVTNQKGGVGKTTTTEHLGIGLVRQGKTVLLIDMDPQANLTASLGWKNVDALKKTVSDVLDAIMLEKDVSFEDMILHHDEEVDLIPSNIRLADTDQRLTGAFIKEKTLTKGIESIKKDYDYILIDCPPTLGNLTINSLVAADEALITVEPQYLPAVGMTQPIKTIERVRSNLSPGLRYSSIVFTKVNIQTIYIFEYGLKEDTSGTQHQIMPGNVFDKLSGDKSAAEWLMDAVDGNIGSYGLDLLDREY